MGNFFCVEPFVQDAGAQLKNILNFSNDELKPVVDDIELKELMLKEKQFLKSQGADVEITDISKHLTFVLHWKDELRQRSGFFCNFNESLLPVSGQYHDPQRNPLQVAYSHEKEIFIDSDE